MSRKLGLVVVSAIAALFLLVLTGDGRDASDPTLAPTLSLAVQDATPSTIGSTPAPLSEASSARLLAEQAVEEYWAHLSADASRVAALLQMPPDQVTRELGLAEYSAAYGGRYEAECVAGVIVEDEVIVDCLVEVLDEPLATAFDIGATPTQFRVQAGRITQVGYLKPYSTVDLALSSYAQRIDSVGFEDACSNPDGRYQSDAGVVYSGKCGVFLALLVDAVLTDLRSSDVCAEDCTAALLSAIRPARD